ncbi:MAG: hypothetical protein K8J08_12600 [Thermoanaerobaculia bacterium]|nr:hypothetical protein [Thermoanaerobaculia bacterium]
MNPKANPLLAFSALAYGAGALPLLFMPEELMTATGAESNPISVTVLQLLAGALFGFAMLNWMSRYSRLGGIFGRPLIVANFAHAAIAVPALIRIVLAGDRSLPFMIAPGIYGLLLVGFGAKLFGPTPVDDRG